jgi:TetR/AcrR family transcriptional regulator, transcriptional repressor for nem operon
MGRSSRSQANANRVRIVEVASGLFRAHGIEAVSISDVMKAAGMTQGGFYKHFASKDALAAEACELAFTKAAENWRRVAQDAADHGRDVAKAITAYYLAPKAPEMTCPMVALATDVAKRAPDDPLCGAYNAGVRNLFDTFAELATAHASRATTDRLRMLFAGMVGSNMLARSGNGGDWSAGFKKSVAATADMVGGQRDRFRRSARHTHNPAFQGQQPTPEGLIAEASV